MNFDAPLVCPARTVPNEWIDYNGHMNMAYYSMAFDQALDYVFDLLGVGADYVKQRGGSCFTLEAHVSYLRELQQADPFRIHFQLIDCDQKRLHYFEQMYHAVDGYLAATSEQICLHVDMASRRSAPFPDDIQRNIDALMAAHRNLSVPEQVGRRIGIAHK